MIRLLFSLPFKKSLPVCPIIVFIIPDKAYVKNRKDHLVMSKLHFRPLLQMRKKEAEALIQFCKIIFRLPLNTYAPLKSGKQ